MTITAIKSQIVPGPIRHGADFVSSTKEIKEVEPEPHVPSDDTADTNSLNFNDRLMASNSRHRTFIDVLE
ncbi:MAG: hypothetical protein RL421_855, partial [Actinomycetota bacterium]